MGICNNKSRQKQTAYSTKALLQTQCFQKINFYFTTQNLLRFDADCLVLFCNEKINLHQNIYLTRVGKTEAKKIKEFAEAYLLTNKARIMPGQVIFFPIAIASLRFKFVALVCLKVWDGHQKISINIKKALQTLFLQLNRHEIKSVAITQFNQEFGIPTHLGCKLTTLQIYQAKDWLKIVTIICDDTQSQSYYMEKIVEFKPETSLSESGKQSGFSNYY